MTRKEIVRELSNTVGCSEAQSAKHLFALELLIRSAMRRGDTVRLSNVGEFSTYESRETVRFGVKVPARPTVRFRKSRNLKAV